MMTMMVMMMMMMMMMMTTTTTTTMMMMMTIFSLHVAPSDKSSRVTRTSVMIMMTDCYDNDDRWL